MKCKTKQKDYDEYNFQKVNLIVTRPDEVANEFNKYFCNSG